MSVSARTDYRHGDSLTVHPETGDVTQLTPRGCAQHLLHRGFGPPPWSCNYCGVSVACTCLRGTGPLLAPATTDHIYPVMRGGRNTMENCTPACGPCNSAKSMALWPHEWTQTGGLDLAAVGKTPPLNPGGPLSARAYGVLTFLRERPDIPASPPALAPHFTDGRESLRAALGELVATGRLAVTAARHGNLVRWQIGATL